MATGGGGGGGGDGAGGASHDIPLRLRPDEVVHLFLSRRHAYLPPIPRRRTHSTSSSTSTLSHTSSLGLMEAVSRAHGTPTSPRHSMRGLPAAASSSSSQYGLRSGGGGGGVMQRKPSAGELSSGYPSPMLAAAKAARASSASSSGGSMYPSGGASYHAAARSVASLPMDACGATSASSAAASAMAAHHHVPMGRRRSAPLALSPQFQATAAAAMSADPASYAAEIRRRDRYRTRGPWAAAADRLSPAADGNSRDYDHGHGRHGEDEDAGDGYAHSQSAHGGGAVAGGGAAVLSALPAAAAAAASLDIDNGYDASSENLAMVGKPPKVASSSGSGGGGGVGGGGRQDKEKDKDSKTKASKGGWKDTLMRRKGKPEAKRRDDGGLSDIAASATTSQCTTPVPPPLPDEDEEPGVLRKVSHGSQSPSSDRDEGGKKKGEQSGSIFNRLRNLKRSVSRDAAANLSDGNGSDSGKRKKDKRRSSRKKKGHLRQRSEDLNNNDPTAHSAGFPEASASSTAPTHRRRRSTGVPAASLSSSAAAAIFSNSRDPYELSSSSDEALNVLASAGGEQDHDVSCLRDEFSQEVKLNQFPTPEPSSPVTPTLRLRPSGDHPHPRPYSSDVDTGEISYDVLADSASVASEPIGAVARGRSNSQRSDDEWLGGFDQANVDNVMDKFTELSKEIEKEYPVAIARIVQKLTKGYSFRSYEEYARLALELLGQIGLLDSELNMIVLLVMTSHLLSALPDNVRHLQVEIERHSSRLLKEYFFEYFHTGAAHAWSWIRRSFRRGEDGIAEVRRQSARAGGGAEATGGASASGGGGAAVSGGFRQTRTSPLVVADQSAAAASTLRLRGAPAGSSARETGLRQLQQRGSSTPVLRLRPASSAPGHGSHLSEGDQLEGDEEDVMHE